jgi:type IV secretion system protein VirD4
MWISTLLRGVIRGGIEHHNHVHFVLDEAATLGQLDQLDDAVDKYRAYGVRLIFIYQSLGQLRKCFPDGQEQTLLSNVTQVFFGVNDQQTAEYVSSRLGEQTIVVNSGGTSRGTSRQHNESSANGSYGTSWNGSENWQPQGRKLFKPEEVMALSPRTAITFAPGLPPLSTRLIRYYEERPDSLWQKKSRALRTPLYSLALLGGTCIAALQATEIYQQQHSVRPPMRTAPFVHHQERKISHEVLGKGGANILQRSR